MYENRAILKSIIPKIFGSKQDSRENSEEDIAQSDGNEQGLAFLLILHYYKTRF